MKNDETKQKQSSISLLTQEQTQKEQGFKHDNK